MNKHSIVPSVSESSQSCEPEGTSKAMENEPYLQSRFLPRQKHFMVIISILYNMLYNRSRTTPTSFADAI